jgi:WD40 repeat protein
LINLWDLAGGKLCGTLIGQSQNICKLLVFTKEKKTTPFVFGSCSWDGSARCWAEDSSFIELGVEGTGSCWSLAALGRDSFVTGHADKSLRIWRGDRQVQVIQSAHRDVVRDVLSIDDSCFLTAGNDGAIKVWDSVSGNPLQTIESAHSAFIYGLTWNGRDRVASFGEEGIVKIWKFDNKKLTEEGQILVPMMSAWCACFLNENCLIVGGSTGSFYTFSSDSTDSQVFEAFEAEMTAFEAAAKSSKSAEIEKNAQDESVLRYPGERVGKIVLVRRGGSADAGVGAIEAHQWDGAEWQNLGQVVDPMAVKSPDFNFKVELDDLGRSYDLQYNWGENPYTVAKNFLERNDLPITHLDEVANFIVKNTGTPPPPTSSLSELVNESNVKVPIDPGVFLVSAYNAEGILNKLKSFGMTEVTIEAVCDALKTWPNEKLFPCLDWLRVRVLQEPETENILEIVPIDSILEAGTIEDSGKESVANITMLLRLMCNCKDPSEDLIIKVVGKCCQNINNAWVPLLVGILYNNSKDRMDVTKCMALLNLLMSKRPAALLTADEVARIYWTLRRVKEKSAGKIPLAAALKKEMEGQKGLEIVSSLL